MAAKKKAAGKSIDLKIEEAKKAAKKANKRVAADKWAGAYSDERNPSAIKAKNVRKALDAGKTAMRAKNIERKRALPVPPQLKDERAAAQAMAKAKKPLTASEKAFLKNQAEKKKATKRTGVYPNTAN
jgi:hypothetical protein